MSTKLKKILSFFFIAASVTVVFFIAFSNTELKDAWGTISKLDLLWLSGIFLCWAVCAFFDGMKITLMYNPEIISKAAPFETEESCLSLLGAPRKTTRYRTIKVKYQDSSFIWRTKTYTGFTAQIIQHETDHCNGILI